MAQDFTRQGIGESKRIGHRVSDDGLYLDANN